MKSIIIISSISLFISCAFPKNSLNISDICDTQICILPGMSIDNLLIKINLDKQLLLDTENFSFPVIKWDKCNNEDIVESNYEYLVKFLELNTDDGKILNKVTYGILYSPFDTSHEEYLNYTKKEMLNYFSCINSFERKYNNGSTRDSIISNDFLFIIDKSDTTRYKVVIEIL